MGMMANGKKSGNFLSNAWDFIGSDQGADMFGRMADGQSFGGAYAGSIDAMREQQMKQQELELKRMYYQGLVGRGQNPANLQYFNAMTQGFSPEETDQARRVAMGLQARPSSVPNDIFMIGDVPHMYNKTTGQAEPVKIAGREIGVDEVASNKGTISESQEFGKGKGKFSAETLATAYTSYGKVNESLYNIKRMIGALDNGARVGVLENLMPSIRAASVEFDNLRNRMGLDIIGSVTFGALSEGELKIALETAMPKFANEADARDWLTRRATAQEKLMGYLQDQMNWINNGGSVIDFLNTRGGTLNAQMPGAGNQQPGPGPAPGPMPGPGGGQTVPMPPQIGQVIDGYIYMGGNPADQNSWRMQ